MGYTQDGIGFQKTDTSRAAADEIAPKATSIREQVFDLLKNSAPLSTEEIADQLSRPYVSVQPRLSELQNVGKVVDSGERGITRWGKSCILWEVTSRA